MTWEEINLKYPEDFDYMIRERRLEFINDCFDCYEQEGFSKKFWSPYGDKKSYIGKRFTVVRRYDSANCDLDCLPMWDIKFSDGTVFGAYPEEIIPSEMRENGCPFKEF